MKVYAKYAVAGWKVLAGSYDCVRLILGADRGDRRTELLAGVFDRGVPVQIQDIYALDAPKRCQTSISDVRAYVTKERLDGVALLMTCNSMTLEPQ